MDTQVSITYQITDPLTNEYFVVNEEYQARHYYDRGYLVTEYHTTVTLLPPFSKARLRIATHWHDNDLENNNHEPEIEEE